MSKIKEIFDGFKNTLILDEVVNEVAAKRLAICNACTSKISMMGCECCGECHCIIAIKVKSPGTNCPLNKWII